MFISEYIFQLIFNLKYVKWYNSSYKIGHISRKYNSKQRFSHTRTDVHLPSYSKMIHGYSKRSGNRFPHLWIVLFECYLMYVLLENTYNWTAHCCIFINNKSNTYICRSLCCWKWFVVSAMMAGRWWNTQSLASLLLLIWKSININIIWILLLCKHLIYSQYF